MTAIGNPPPDTGQFIASATSKKPNRIGLVIVVVIAILATICCCCLPTITRMISSTPTVTSELSLEPSYTPLAGQSFARTEDAATAEAISDTATPIPESSRINLSLSQFMEQYNNGTDLQREQFPEQSKDKWISWSGEVSNVSEDGKISVEIPNTLASFVDVKGISPDVAAKISKNEIIGFTGRITKMIDFLGVRITVEDAQLLEVLPTEVALTPSPTDTQEVILGTETPQPENTPVIKATPTTQKIAPTVPACRPEYSGVCIPYGPRLTCAELREQFGIYNFAVPGSDPLDYDRNHDGVGCEN